MADDHPPGLVSVPMVDWMYSRAALSLMSVSHHLPEGCGLDFNSNGSTICGKRNSSVHRTLGKSRYRWLLFLDSDMVFPPDVAFRLLEHDAGVVGGLYTFKKPDYYPAAGYEDGARSDDPLRPSDAPGWKYECLDLQEVGAELGTVEVDLVGTGCMLVRREVFEVLDLPWFVANESQTESYGQGEDINFCLRAQDAGFSVVCDTEVQAEHIGPHGVTVPKAKGHLIEKKLAAQEPQRVGAS